MTDPPDVATYPGLGGGGGGRRRRPRRARREPITSERIVDTALEIMAEHGFEAVTMRSIAQRLGTGPASLYAHLDGRDELHALIVDRLADEIQVPDPDPLHWQDQLFQVGRDMRAAMSRRPGVARAVIGYVPVGPEAATVSERAFAILLAGGLAPQVAAWACDLLPLYVTAVAFEESVRGRSGGPDEPDFEQVAAQLRSYYEALPPELFPNSTRHAVELTTGDGEVRFEFGMRVLLAGLAAVSASYREGST